MIRNRSAIGLLFLFTLASGLAQTPQKDPSPPPQPGEKMIAEYFKIQTKRIAENCLKNFKTKEEWEKARPELRRQLLEMLGLWPMPAQTDLKAKVTGTIDREKFTVEKIQFQSMPNLFVTANLYLPKPALKKAPTIWFFSSLVMAHNTNGAARRKPHATVRMRPKTKRFCKMSAIKPPARTPASPETSRVGPKETPASFRLKSL